MIERLIKYAALALVALLAGAPSAFAAITLEWDPSPDPRVTAYRVYVGTTSGAYTERFDVGQTTSFVYNAREARVYYFAVVAYAGIVPGPFSVEVAATAGEAASEALIFWSLIWQSPLRPTARGRANPSAQPLCWQREGVDCVRPSVQFTAPSAITSLAPADDERLFFIEGERRIRVVTSGRDAGETVLAERRQAVVLTQIVLSRTFAMTGFAYVGEVQTSGNGEREFRIVRYRIAQNRAVERSVIVRGLRVSGPGVPRFNVDSQDELLVAMPAGASRGEYEGWVLSFNDDGSTAHDASLSPSALASGYSLPNALSFDATRRRWWLAGEASSSLASLDPGTTWLSLRSVHGTPAIVAMTSQQMPDGTTALMTITADGAIRRVTWNRQGDSLEESLRLHGAGYPTAIAASRGRLYIVLRQPFSSTSESSAIIRLDSTAEAVRR